MTAPTRLRIAVLPGDGIGPEVMEPTLGLLRRAADAAGGVVLEFDEIPAGAGHYRSHGVSIEPQALERAASADAILLAAMGLPEVRYPDGTEIAPQLELREALKLYAGVRPVRPIPGLPGPLADPRATTMDLVLVRESTEGLFAARNKSVRIGDQEARDTMVITRAVCEKLFDFALELGRKRKQEGRPGRVTCVDKANVLGSFAFFRGIFSERARRFPDVSVDYAYVDAVGLNLVRRPWDYDVLVTENMFGDILSDVGAGLIGGMGLAPSADIGDRHAVFQPCHGSAPDIAGQGRANPAAMILSAAMMLVWLGERRSCGRCLAAGRLLSAAVDEAFRAGDCVPMDLGGGADTATIVAAVSAALDSDAARSVLG